MLDETYWRTQMRSHTPIGLAVAFYLIFIVIIFYLLPSPAFLPPTLFYLSPTMVIFKPTNGIFKPTLFFSF